MKTCCSLCDEVLINSVPHSELALLSELTESKIYKCHLCKTFIHFSSGDWEIMIPSPLRDDSIKHEPSEQLPCKQEKKIDQLDNKPQQMAC